MIEVYRLCHVDDGTEELTLSPTHAAKVGKSLKAKVEVLHCVPQCAEELWDFTGDEIEDTIPDGHPTEIPPKM